MGGGAGAAVKIAWEGAERRLFVPSTWKGAVFSRWLEAVTTLYQFALSDGGGGWAVHQEDAGW